MNVFTITIIASILLVLIACGSHYNDSNKINSSTAQIDSSLIRDTVIMDEPSSGPKGDNNEKTIHLEGKWEFITLSGEAVHLDLETSDLPHIIFRSEEENFKAWVGCNSIFGQFKRSADQIQFTDIGYTEMYCFKVMDTEKLFLEAIQSASSLSINGSLLTISNSNHTLATFERVQE